MSTPFIWIIIPLIFASLLWLLRKYDHFVKYSAIILCASVLLIAYLFPQDPFITLGSFVIEISNELMILGRRFILNTQDLPIIVFLFGSAAFWFGGTFALKLNENFIPAALAILGLLIASIAVVPYLFAAIFIEVSVLIFVLVILQDSKSVQQGVLRFLVFQTLAMAFVLMAGWSSAGVEANPADPFILNLTVVLLALGFAILLTFVPFHSWLPLFVRQTNPYLGGFILTFLPIAVIFLGLNFLNEYAWLRNFPQLFELMRVAGILIVVYAGISAASADDLGRMFAYVLLLENGFVVIALSLNNLPGLTILVLSLLSRVVGLSVWSLSLSTLGYLPSEDFSALTGFMRRFPIAASGLILSGLSFSGLPLLASFPVRYLLFENMVLVSPEQTAAVFLGSLGFLIGIVRTARLLVLTDQNKWTISESPIQAALLMGGILLIIMIGVFPRLYAPWMLTMLESFEYLP